MQDVTHLLEQLEAFEERCAVTLEALFAEFEDQFLWVKGEVRPRDGSQLKQDVSIIVDVYDQQKRLISRGEHRVWAESFLGFETFEIITGGSSEIAKIRIYPKL
jgi:hypothetical protein